MACTRGVGLSWVGCGVYARSQRRYDLAHSTPPPAADIVLPTTSHAARPRGTGRGGAPRQHTALEASGGRRRAPGGRWTAHHQDGQRAKEGGPMPWTSRDFHWRNYPPALRVTI